MEIFAQRHEEQFINKLTEVAVTAFPEIAWAYGWVDGPERFRALVRKYVDEGYAYGLTYEYTELWIKIRTVLIETFIHTIRIPET